MKRLNNEQRWCVWSYVEDDTGRKTKVPFSAQSVANGEPYMVSSTKPKQWAVSKVVDRAIEVAPEFSRGVMLGAVDDGEYALIGIDFDGTDSDEIYEFAVDVVSEWDSYTEVSPSGAGMKLFALIRSDEVSQIEMKQDWTSVASVGGHVEATFHRGRRFFAVTGEALFGFEDLNVVSLETVNKFIAVDQPKFLELARPYARETSQGQRSGGGIDRSANVIQYVAAELRRDPTLGEQDVFERIQNLPQRSPEDRAAVDWVQDQVNSGTAGERQLSRAYDKVASHLDDWSIFDSETNPAFEDLEGETVTTRPKPSAAEVEEIETGVRIPDYVKIMNSAYGYCLLGNKSRVIKWRDDGTFWVLGMQSFHDDAGDVGEIEVDGARIPISRAWMKHGLKRRFEGITFDPSSPGEPSIIRGRKFFNVCPPWGVKPKAGNPEGVLKVIRESVCSHEEESEWLLDYLAHMVQKPSDRPSIHPILFGDMGIGKDVLINVMKRILPQDTVVDFDFGRGSDFNSRLKTGLLINVPEARDLSYAATEAKMKDYMTMKTVEINEKYVPEFSLPFYGRFFFTTNEVTAMPVGPGDRRFVPIMGRSKYGSLSTELELADRLAFFDDVYDNYINGGQAGVFLQYLLDRDISAFKANTQPDFIFKDGSIRSMMVDGQMGLDMETFSAMLEVDRDAEGPENHFFMENKTHGTYVIPSEVVGMAKSIEADYPTNKQSHLKPKQMSTYLMTFAKAKSTVMKIDRKSKHVWVLDKDELLKRIGKAKN